MLRCALFLTRRDSRRYHATLAEIRKKSEKRWRWYEGSPEIKMSAAPCTAWSWGSSCHWPVSQMFKGQTNKPDVIYCTPHIFCATKHSALNTGEVCVLSPVGVCRSAWAHHTHCLWTAETQTHTEREGKRPKQCQKTTHTHLFVLNKCVGVFFFVLLDCTAMCMKSAL